MIAKTLSRLGIEVWKDIPTFEKKYQVSNLGNVRALNYKRMNIIKNLKKPINNSGRHYVCLCNKGSIFSNSNVYVLVARAFLGHKPCGYKLVVDHKDNNPLNDRLYNLQVISQRQNMSKEKRGSSKYTGVCWAKSLDKWKSYIYINGKLKHLGYFTDEKEASQAYINELNKIK
jgi:hypothetical protein